MLIADFYENQEIFLTGGSGFIGKALLEKILRSCPKVGKLYVLLRDKKDKNAADRLREILGTVVFDRIRREQPNALKKVEAISGDCSLLGLGISSSDLMRIQNTSIIIHSAASVRFDDDLRDAILLNTRGTFELVKIAETLKNLKVFMHVSTTYCYPDMRVVDEKVYPPYADWRTTIKLAETFNTETLNIFNLKYSSNQPNTYTFTKSLSEQIILEYKDKLPMVILRPSIVIASLLEPVPGWVDNFNGPIGMLVACGVGIMRTNCAEPDIVSDFVPVDVVVRSIITACAKKGWEGHDRNADNKLVIYNASTGGTVKLPTTGEIVEMGKKVIKENPFEKTLWVPGGSITRCKVWNLIRFITLHILMAIVVDLILRLTKQKPFLLKLQRRIYAAAVALHFFVINFWIFTNTNTLALDDTVTEEERDIFAFKQYSDIDYEDFVRTGIRGAKQFLLHEPPDSSNGAKMRFRIFEILHFLIQWTGSLLLIRFVIRYLYHHYYKVQI